MGCIHSSASVSFECPVLMSVACSSAVVGTLVYALPIGGKLTQDYRHDLPAHCSPLSGVGQFVTAIPGGAFCHNSEVISVCMTEIWGNVLML